MARDPFADSYGQTPSPFRDTPNQSRPSAPAAPQQPMTGASGMPNYPADPAMQAWRNKSTPTKTGGAYGGYDSLDNFITGNWQIGYGNKPVDVQSWKNYMSKAGPQDYDYWGKRIQGWQAGGADMATQGPYAFGAGSPNAAARFNSPLMSAVMFGQLQPQQSQDDPYYKQVLQAYMQTNGR